MGLFQLFVGFFILYAQSAMATGKKSERFVSCSKTKFIFFVVIFLVYLFLKKGQCLSLEPLFAWPFISREFLYLFLELSFNFFFIKERSHVRLRHPSCVYITAQSHTLQYKRCVHLWNNFPCIIIWVLTMAKKHNISF